MADVDWSQYDAKPPAHPAAGGVDWSMYDAKPHPASAPMTVSGTAKAAGSGAAGSGLALSGGSVGDLREVGRATVDKALSKLVKRGVITQAQADAAHHGIASVYHGFNPMEAALTGINNVASLTAAATDRPKPAPVVAPTTQELQAATHTAYTPRNRLERYARTGGAMAVNALAPGGLASRAANVILPTIGSEGAREVTEAAGGGQEAQNAASIAGAIGGGVLSGSVGLRPNVRTTVSPENAAVNAFARNAKPDINALEAKANEYHAANIEPTLTDITDESGRGVIRAAASRVTPARTVAQDFGDRRALDLPDRMGRQSSRIMSSDGRTPAEIAQQLAANRKAMADKQFAAVRNEPVEMTPETVSALRTDHGKQAILEAARRERNPDTRAALNRLSRDALDAPNTRITVGMADRISRVLNGRAGAALRSGDNDLDATLGDMASSVRNPARAASPGYGDALGNYATETRAMEAAGKGEDFLARNTDEFVSDVKKMAPDELELARATARRAVERKSGESISAAPGVARALAEAPEQRARNAALLGPDAPKFEQAMRLEELSVRNARDIAPRTGSQTFLRGQDALDTGKAAVRGFTQVARGDVIGATFNAAEVWLKSRGLNDAQAEALVKMATDPKQTRAIVEQLRGTIGRKHTTTFMTRFRKRLVLAGKNPALISASAATVPLRQQERR